jgi:hypothetical protein
LCALGAVAAVAFTWSPHGSHTGIAAVASLRTAPPIIVQTVPAAVTAPPSPAAVTPEDAAFQRSVERLYRERIAAAAQHEQRRDREDWRRLVAAAQSARQIFAERMVPPEVRLIVTAPDTTFAQQLLLAWVHTNGALAPEGNRQAGAGGPTVTFQIDPRDGATLLNLLRKSGDVAEQVPAERAASRGQPSVKRPIPAVPVAEGPGTARAAVPVDAAPGRAPDAYPAPVASVPAVRHRLANVVTVVVAFRQ